MPSAPKKPCAQPGCHNLVDVGFCDKCKSNPALAHERKSANERGYTYRWQKLAKAYLRLHPFAVDVFGTHEPGRVYVAEVVDHIIPHKGDQILFWSVSNLQGLTAADHSRKTALEDGGFGNAPKT
jgi:5-methylcytosine-specific restriction protein A